MGRTKPEKPLAREAGYGCPPERTRFKKGHSGNPRGRPKGTQNLATVLQRILRELVTTHVNGRPKVVTKLEFALQQLVDKATSGDPRALQQLVALARSAEERPPQQDSESLPECDQKVLERILQRATQAQSDAVNDEAEPQ